MTADPATVATARQLLGQLGISTADLQTTPSAMEIPTVAEYVRRVKAATGPGARRTYATYWDRMAAMWGERPMTNFAATDFEFLKNESAAFLSITAQQPTRPARRRACCSRGPCPVQLRHRRRDHRRRRPATQICLSHEPPGMSSS